MHVYRCDIERAISCYNIQVDVVDEKLVKLDTASSIGVVFTHTPITCVICTGVEFQVYVWGDKKYTLWLLPPGENYCIVLEYCYVDHCLDHVYVVSRAQYSCERLEEYKCVDKLVNIANRMKIPVFVNLDIPCLHINNLVNFINSHDLMKCNNELARTKLAEQSKL
jgi:hypothetical protein